MDVPMTLFKSRQMQNFKIVQYGGPVITASEFRHDIELIESLEIKG